MAVAMVVGTGAFIGILTLTNTLVNKLVPSNDGTNFGEETLNDSTIENEEKNNRSATFLFDFENGSTTLIIIIIGGIVTLLLAIGCCIFFCGCSRFGSQFCCRKSNTTTGEQLYKERLYDLQRKVINNEIYEYPKFEDNEHKNENNGRQEQNDNKIEKIVQLPNVDQTQYTVISEKNKKTDYGNRTSKLVQKITDDTDSTDGADDTDGTYTQL